ncbi:synaptotagmin-12 [Bacillus rossius redtenbacheri]|uniref:synaptotagmin-12 n=1 Tax=Bacillus rossius redtenbacheri TaxID=93214 RepID=UPI002FDCA9E4
MSEGQLALALLGAAALLLLLLLSACRLTGLWTRAAAWLTSSREETIGLTKARGHYAANGYLVHSDSDVQLDATGSFQHFDLVDRDLGVAFTTSSLTTQGPGPAPPPPAACLEEALSRAVAEDCPAEPELTQPAVLQRAMSCDSVCSDTSVAPGDLVEPGVTGGLCVGLEYDSEAADLLVSVLEAKDLVGPDNSSVDTYVRVYLLPDKTTSMQTRVYRKSNCPSYKEKFLFAVDPAEYGRRSLAFYVYASDKLSNTLVDEAELRLCDVAPRQPVTTWLTLTDSSERGTECGELMFSLSYLPTAERLTVVVVKARNLQLPQGDGGEVFVKVYLLQHGKKVHKKKTSMKRGETSLIFNEAMIFSVPAHALQTIHLRLSVAEATAEGRALAVGHVIVGLQASGKALSHWSQMLASLRKPVAMWHPLRK